MLCHQPTPYGMDMIPIAKVQNLSYFTISSHFILVNFKNSPPNFFVTIIILTHVNEDKK